VRNRLHALCPYFAMFPESFVAEQVSSHTKPGDIIFDPFSGRGTTVLQSLLMGRRAIALDINPVAYCISRAKADVPPLCDVLDEIAALESAYKNADAEALEAIRCGLPRFYRRAFYHSTLRELLFLRASLKWRVNPVHCFISALALGCLHGEKGKPFQYFSNQMPRTISTKPDYSVRYWEAHNLWPERRKVFSTLRRRAAYRLCGDVPKLRGEVKMGDARDGAKHFPHLQTSAAMVLTSPPYLDVTSYEEDQWLRMWFLGYPERPSYRKISKDDRHTSGPAYWRFLSDVWSGISPLLRDRAVIVCRLGAKGVKKGDLTRNIMNSMRRAFPGARLTKEPLLSRIRGRQTECFRPGSEGCLYEVDYTFVVS